MLARISSNANRRHIGVRGPSGAGRTRWVALADGPGLIQRQALCERLEAASPGGVVLVCAPAGSGKSVLVRSWAEPSGWRERMAWVSVESVERNGQRFWLSVIDALGQLTGSERILQRLEEQLELRRASPTLTGSLHRAAAEWHEREGDIVEAIRHARAAHEWRLVSRLLKAPEIAAELWVSPNTVRTHIRHIYAKLGAHDRNDPVARARELGLLAC